MKPARSPDSLLYFPRPNVPVHPEDTWYRVEVLRVSAWVILQLTLEVLRTPRTIRFEWSRASEEKFTLPWKCFSALPGIRLFYQHSFLLLSSFSPPRDASPVESQYLAALTYSILPLCPYLINFISSAAAEKEKKFSKPSTE